MERAADMSRSEATMTETQQKPEKTELTEKT